MVEPPRGDPPLWVGDRDPEGRPVERTVVESAQRIWRRVLYYVRKERNDDAEAAEVLEQTVYAVSQRVRSAGDQDPIQSIDAYLYHSFVRRFVKRVLRGDRVQYFDSAETLDSIGSAPARDWVSELDNEILLQEVIGTMTPRVRQMFALRCAGHSWEEVGRQFGISKHNAEVQFAYGLKKVKAELGLEDKEPQPRRRTK